MEDVSELANYGAGRDQARKPGGQLVGDTIQFQVADGYAQYIEEVARVKAMQEIFAKKKS